MPKLCVRARCAPSELRYCQRPAAVPFHGSLKSPSHPHYSSALPNLSSATTRRSFQSSSARFQTATAAPVRSKTRSHADTSGSPDAATAAGGSAGGGGIRDRLRFWAYNNDMTKRRLAVEAEEARVAADEAAMADVQVSEADLDDYDPDEMERYIDELDNVSSSDYDTDDLVSHTRAQNKPGDIVEMAGSGPMSARIAVHLRTNGDLYQYYSIGGTMKFTNYPAVLFRASGYVTQEDLEPVLSSLPNTMGSEVHELMVPLRYAVPREVGASLIGKMKLFYAQYEAEFRKYASEFDTAHDVVAHPNQVRVMALEDITTQVTGVPKDQLTPPLLLACSQALFRGGPGFRASMRLYAAHLYLEVESKEAVDMIERVAASARAVQEAHALCAAGQEIPADLADSATLIQSFAAKVRPLIQHSRSIRHYSPDGVVLANAQDAAMPPPQNLDLAFSESDKAVIQFLVSFMSLKSFFYLPRFRSIAPVILSEVGMHNAHQTLDVEAVHTLLVEIGVMQPYDAPVDVQREQLLDNPATEQALQAIEDRISAGEDIFSAAGFKDSMETIRHDFGDMPAFAIDSSGAIDIDDAVSLEEVPDSPGHHWMHIHTAHNAAFMAPDGALIDRMRNRLLTHYLHETRHPLLPEWASAPFSLKPGAPTLTASLLLDEHSNIVDTKIRAGKIKNLVRITPETINKLFGYQDPLRDPTTLDVGARQDSKDAVDEPVALSEDHATVLKKLYGLVTPMRKARLHAAPFGVMTPDKSFESLQVMPRIGASYSVRTTTMPEAAHYAAEDPWVHYAKDVLQDARLVGLELEESPANVLVGECMLAANRCTGDWAAARGLPMPYAGTGSARTDDPQVEILRNELRSMAQGEIPYERRPFTWFRRLFARAVLSSSPVFHRPLGFPAYLRMTSPLRKLPDAICHWNVNAALLEESRRGTALQPDDDKSFVPFSAADIDQFNNWFAWRKNEFLRIRSSRRKHWQVYAFMRAFYLKEAPLPSPLVVSFHTYGGNRRNGSIDGLEISVDTTYLKGDDGNEIAEGDRWEVEVDKIEPGTRRILVRPTKRLVSGREVRARKRKALGTFDPPLIRKRMV